MNTKRDEYVEKLKLQLDDWNEDLDRLEKLAGELRSDAKSAYQERIADLRGKRREVERKLRGLRTAGESAWAAMKSGLEEAREEFQRSFEETRREGPAPDVKPILEAGEPLSPPHSESSQSDSSESDSSQSERRK